MQDLIDEETQTVFEWPGASKMPNAKATPVDGVLSTSNDPSSSILSLEIPLPPRPTRAPPHTLLITVVDRSGSMSGYWSRQVVPALRSLAEIAWDSEDQMTTHIITYATNISTITLDTRAGFTSDLDSTRAAGGTHFSKAFKAIQDSVEKLLPPLKQKHGQNLVVIVAFMTDGEDSEGRNMSGQPVYSVALEQLSAYLRTSSLMAGIPSMFHALAFGAGHDFAFLDNLRANAGTMEGGFQYADPAEGSLKPKLDAIVKSVTNPAVQTRLRFEIPGYLTNSGSVMEENWTAGTSPLQNLVLFRAGQNKVIVSVTVKPLATPDSTAPAEASSSDSQNIASSSASSSTGDAQISTTSHEFITPVNTSAGITYATDYYGQYMPSFPQPGFSYASNTVLYQEDPYMSIAASFGPQPGMSHLADFGPQPGMSHVNSLPDTLQLPKISPASVAVLESPAAVAPAAPTSAAPAHAEPSAHSKASNSAAPEIGAEFITVKVYQLRQDEIARGEIMTEAKIRVDRLLSQADTLLLLTQRMKIVMEALELEITTKILSKSAPASVWSRYAAYINTLEKDLNNATSFVVGLPRSKRTAVLEASTAVRESFTRLHALLASATKGAWDSSQLARLAETTHGAQFSKARHARTMDSRTTKNAGDIEKEEKRVREMVIDADAVTDYVYNDRESDDAEKLLREWYCVLTQDHWMNLLVDEKDCIGFGIALRRPEFVIDDPTQLRILDMSLTCVSKSSFEHVLTHKLIQAAKDSTDPIQAKLAYLGGFNVEGKDLGVVVRGTANEPINAWLPLYINAEHWKLAFAQFKSMTGFLVTMDPRGFALSQVDVYFMILATMIVRMRVASNRQIEMTMQYLRTCIAIMEDFTGYKARMKKVLESFIKNPADRLKDVTPSLLVVLGYLVVLPLDSLRVLLPTDEDWTKLWLGLFTELTRRALDTCSRFGRLGNESATLFTNLISRLVDGYLEESELSDEELANVFDPKEEAAHQAVFRDIKPSPFKAFSTGPTATDKQLEEKARLQKNPKPLQLKVEDEKKQPVSLWSAFWDSVEKDEKPHAMEWASLRATDDFRVMPQRLVANTDASTSGAAAEGRHHVDHEVSRASFHIPAAAFSDMSMFFDRGALDAMDAQNAKKDAAMQKRHGLVDGEALKKREFKADAVLPTSIEAIHLCENVVRNFGNPTVEGLINVMSFFHSWMSIQVLCGGTWLAVEQLDKNLGVAPVSWLVTLRDDWQRRPQVRHSFFSFFKFIDVTQLSSFKRQAATSSLRAQVLQTQMLRAILAQNAKYATNKDARIAMETTSMALENRWHDPLEASATILEAYHKERVTRLITVASNAAAASATADSIRSMTATNDIYTFIGLLLGGSSAIGTNRNTVRFTNLIRAFYEPIAPRHPLAVLKLSILLSGRFLDPVSGVVVTIIPGREWVPGRLHLSRFHRTWGDAYKAVTAMINLTYIREKSMHLSQPEH